MDFWQNAIWSVTPTIVIGGFFGFIVRACIVGDRNERKMHAQVEAEERARMGLPPRAEAEASTPAAAPAAAPAAPASSK